MKLPHGGAKVGGAAPNMRPAGGFDPLPMLGGAPVRLAILIPAVVLPMASLLSACSGGSPAAEPGATESAAMVEKNCNDPHWREQNLGLWYSVCRPPLRW
jgi:hypothetical protein